eukprot:2450431-Rhodomonas_salina.1
MERLTSLSLANEALSCVHVPHMPSLTALNLSSNCLSEVLGLAQLTSLRFLDLSLNPPLDCEAGARLLLTQLHPLAALLAISLPFPVDLHLRSAAAWAGSSAEHVVRLLLGASALQRINGRPVSIADRVRVFRQLGASHAQAAQYLSDLALAASVGRAENCVCGHARATPSPCGVRGGVLRAAKHHPACP